MGFEVGATSREDPDDREEEEDEDEYDEEEEEEGDGANRLFGFMFGNVDNSGDLDADYLDEEAKEHLAAVADKLGTSFRDIHLSVKTPQTRSDAAEQDYYEKAEDAVDYEDIDEQYEGPEVQAMTEEDYLLPRKEYFSKGVTVTAFGNTDSVYDDENYDEDDDLEEKNEVAEDRTEVKPVHSSVYDDENYDEDDDLEEKSEVAEDRTEVQPVHSSGEKIDEESLEDTAFEDELESEMLAADTSDSEEETLNDGGKNISTPLPILCVEDGTVILRFSEIFGLYEPLKKIGKKERKYPLPKEKFKTASIEVNVEEDEEAFLRESSKNIFGVREAQVIQDYAETSTDYYSGSRQFGVIQGTGAADKERSDSFQWSEPLRENLPANIPSDFNLYPLDQLNWEDDIVWDNSPAPDHSIAESLEISGSESDELGSISCLLTETQSQMSKLENKLNQHVQLDFSIWGDPFGSCPLKSPDLAGPEKAFHPQLLRLESRFIQDNPSHVDAGNGESDKTLGDNAIRHFNKIMLQNRDLLEGSWMDNIVWEPDEPIIKPKLILDFQDEQMLFEISDNEENKHLMIHAGAMIVTRSVKANAGDSLELHGLKGPSVGRFNISNDEYYSNRKSSQQLKSNVKKRTAHGLKVLHSIPALKLQTMKAKLSNKDVANFHRPKALWYPHDNEVVLKEQEKMPALGPMKIILKSLGGKGCKLHVDAEETVSSVKAKASKKLDFKLSEPVKIFYKGKELEDQKTLSVQAVRTNSLLHLVRTKLHLLPRAQKLPGENKSLRPPGAFKKKSDLSVKDGHVFLMEYCEERPLLLGNVGMGARLCTYYQKSNPSDQPGNLMRNNGLGTVISLDTADKSPFLGDIKPGCSQSSLETNMYRAPIYQHKVASTDYLLVRSAKGKLSIRRIDRVNVVGQQEPHMEVMAPGSKHHQTYIMNRLLVYMYREFCAIEKRGLRPSIRADELAALFPTLTEALLRKRLKHCADLQKGSGGQLMWVMRRNFRIPLEEELRRMVTPESVCTFESMLAGLYRLKRLGIARLTSPAGLSSAMNLLPDEAIALAAASHIERELQITPWNLSSNFVSCTSQDRENIERLEITGVGDPSGRGHGFSFVRNTPKPAVSNAAVKKKAVVGKGTTVTGTDADLRRLNMKEAREVLLKFNVPDDIIAKNSRWHRIAMIRKLSSDQAATGVKVDQSTIHKYARGQRMSFMQLQQQTREKCQDIWDRQTQKLSAVDGEEIESDSEVNSDLDSFAGDLENLLDAEECDDDDAVNDVSKDDTADGVKGIKMRRRPFQAHADEEIEDEAAEAKELCKMLMDDPEADKKKKKKKIRVVGEQDMLPAPRLKPGSVNVERIQKRKNVVRQNMEFNGSPLRESFARDHREEDNLFAKRNSAGKLKQKKNDNEQDELMNKKVKIKSDGIKNVKEKKSARESFVCGACGQPNHMRTNKLCPNKSGGKFNSLDPMDQPQPKTSTKKLIQKGVLKIAVVEAHEDDDNKFTPKGKILKVKCGTAEKLPEKLTPATSYNSERPVTSDADTGNKAVKVNKITFSNKTKSEDVESHKPAIIFKPPSELDREQPRKKIIIRQPKEIINVDDVSQEGSTGGFEHRKTKNLSDFDEQAASKKNREEEDRRRFMDRERERREGERREGERREREKREGERRERERREGERRERERREGEERLRALFEEQQARNHVEQGKLAGIRKFEEDLSMDAEEETHRAKKKRKKNLEIRESYLGNYSPIRNDRRIPERTAKRKPALDIGRFSSSSGQATKRMRGGEVALSNLLENIVDTLRARGEISYLFMKPVTKKEAPDYHLVIRQPMDLSTIRDKARKMEYRSREDFRRDVWQIVYNAHRYNEGRNPGIPPLADQLLELCDFLLEQNDDSLLKAERIIEHG